MSPEASRAVSSSTGTRFSSARSLRTTSKPERPGSITSSTTRSTAGARGSASALERGLAALGHLDRVALRPPG